MKLVGFSLFLYSPSCSYSLSLLPLKNFVRIKKIATPGLAPSVGGLQVGQVYEYRYQIDYDAFIFFKYLRLLAYDPATREATVEEFQIGQPPGPPMRGLVEVLGGNIYFNEDRSVNRYSGTLHPVTIVPALPTTLVPPPGTVPPVTRVRIPTQLLSYRQGTKRKRSLDAAASAAEGGSEAGKQKRQTSASGVASDGLSPAVAAALSPLGTASAVLVSSLSSATPILTDPLSVASATLVSAAAVLQPRRRDGGDYRAMRQALDEICTGPICPEPLQPRSIIAPPTFRPSPFARSASSLGSASQALALPRFPDPSASSVTAYRRGPGGFSAMRQALEDIYPPPPARSSTPASDSSPASSMGEASLSLGASSQAAASRGASMRVGGALSPMGEEDEEPLESDSPVLRRVQNYVARAARLVRIIAQEKGLGQEETTLFLNWAKQEAKNSALLGHEYSPPEYEEFLVWAELYRG